MKKFLIYSLYSDGAGLAWRLKQEGNIVQIYYATPKYKGTLAGMVDEAKTLQQGLQGCNCVVFDMTHSGPLADKLRRSGYNVVGGGKLCDRLETDRDFALTLMKNLGIKIPEMKTFKTVDQAIQFVEGNKGRRWVVKPDDAGLAMTFVSKDDAELIETLNHWKEKSMVKGEFLLQEFVEGVEISTEIFMSDGKPVYPPNSTFETKKLFNDNEGPNTGCMSSVVWSYGVKEPKIYQKGLKKLMPIFERSGYSGPIDLNTIISSKDGEPYALELTPRFGYSAIYALLELIEGDLGKFLLSIASGKPEVKFKDGFGTAIRLSLPPYPYEAKDEPLMRKVYGPTKGIPIGIDFKQKFNLPLQVYSEDGKYFNAGLDNLVAEISGYGKTIEEASELAYKRAKDARIPDRQMRTDMAANAAKRMKMFQSVGYTYDNYFRRANND
jgi:phosphoribosylamine-glycine ligase